MSQLMIVMVRSDLPILIDGFAAVVVLMALQSRAPAM
jgi:hypothetical protein